MTDEPPSPGPGAREPVSNTPTGTPRWVKLSAMFTVAVIVVIVIIMLVGGGEHGPGRHSGGDRPTPTVAGQHVPPGGHVPQ